MHLCLTASSLSLCSIITTTVNRIQERHNFIALIIVRRNQTGYSKRTGWLRQLYPDSRRKSSAPVDRRRNGLQYQLKRRLQAAVLAVASLLYVILLHSSLKFDCLTSNLKNTSLRKGHMIEALGPVTESTVAIVRSVRSSRYFSCRQIYRLGSLSSGRIFPET